MPIVEQCFSKEVSSLKEESAMQRVPNVLHNSFLPQQLQTSFSGQCPPEQQNMGQSLAVALIQSGLHP